MQEKQQKSVLWGPEKPLQEDGTANAIRCSRSQVECKLDFDIEGYWWNVWSGFSESRERSWMDGIGLSSQSEKTETVSWPAFK